MFIYDIGIYIYKCFYCAYYYTISGDNPQFTENTVITIQSHQLNLDSQEVMTQAGPVIPANIYSNSANSHPSGFKVHDETMLDWVCCKNLCIPGYRNVVFDDFNKLYYNHNNNRLEMVMGD